MSALLLTVLWAACTWPAFSQTSPVYAWTNFVGQPGFEGSADDPDSAENSGNADGTGSAARFYHPLGVAVDNAGNLFVADAGNHTIRKLTGVGVATTLAGGPGARGTNNNREVTVQQLGLDGQPLDGPGASGTNDGTGRAARFCRPESVAVDLAGNVFVADCGNHTIRKVTAAGVVTTLAGSAGNQGSTDGTGRAARFSYPSGVAVDSAGNVFVADCNNNAIRKVTSAGVVTTLAGKAGNQGSADATGSAARFRCPLGVAVDRAGNVFVADTFNHTIRKVSPTGMVTTVAGDASIIGDYGPAGGYEDGKGNAARFCQPRGVAVDSAGNVFVADSGNSTIRKVTPGGVVTTIGGNADVPGWADGIDRSAHFCGPGGIAVDRAGDLYVADCRNNRISKGTPVRP